MKIVHIAPNSPYNDYWGYQDNLLPKYHKKLGHDVTVITTNKTHMNGKITETDCADYILNDGVRVIRLQRKKYFHPILTNLNSKLNVFDYLKELKPDLIFFHGLISTTIFDAVKYKRKINPECIIIQDNHLDYFNGFNCITIKEKIIRSFYRHINKKSIRYVSKVYGVTPLRKTYAEDYFKIPEDKTDILVMGADDEKINFSDKKILREKIRKKLDISDNDFLIISGGKIDENKNIHLLMQACSDIPNIKLLIFGEVKSDIKEKFDCLLKENTNIIYIGWIAADDVYDYFLASDLAVFPGTHSVLWEQACACGIPCVFKAWEGMHHVDTGGNCSFLYKDSMGEIKDVLNGIISDRNKYTEMKHAAEKSKKDFFYSEIARRAIGD